MMVCAKRVIVTQGKASQRLENGEAAAGDNTNNGCRIDIQISSEVRSRALSIIRLCDCREQ